MTDLASELLRLADTAARRRAWSEHVELLERAARAGSGDARMRLGTWWAEGYTVQGRTVVRRNVKRGLRALASAAADGVADAAAVLGTYYNEGKIVTRDTKAAARWYRRAMALGSEIGALNLADLYEASGKRGLARRVVEPVAKAGSVDARLVLAKLDLLDEKATALKRSRARARLKEFARSRSEYLRTKARIYLCELEERQRHPPTPPSRRRKG